MTSQHEQHAQAAEAAIGPPASSAARGVGQLRRTGSPFEARPTRTRRWCTTMLSAIALCLQLCAQNGVSSEQPPGAKRVREVPVFWLMGQSNCAGGANGYWLSNAFEPRNRWPQLARQPFTRIWWPGPSTLRPSATAGWEEYRTGQFSPINNANYHLSESNFGPEASFGDAASRALGETVYLFKYVAVAPLHPDGPTTFSRRLDRESLFDEIIREWQQAAAALKAEGLIPKVRGICWIHGEYDFVTAYTPTYAQNLTRFIADLRAAILRINPDNGEVRFVISEMHDRHVPAASFDVVEAMIRAAQVQVANTVPNVVITDTDDLPIDFGSPSAVHFDAVGDVLLGYRMFASWSQREEPSRR